MLNVRRKTKLPASFRERLPSSLKSILGTNGDFTDRILAAIVVDVTQEGKFGEEWLLVIDDRFQVFSKSLTTKNGAFTSRLDLPLRDIDSVEAVSFVIGGALHASLKGSVIELARYSNSCQHSATQF